MGDMMTFPNTVEEFMEQYKIVDTEKIYTNGAELVPIFRMMQWLEHVSATDCISRRAAIDALGDYMIGKRCPEDGTLTARLIENEVINKLPPSQPKPFGAIKHAGSEHPLSDEEIIPRLRQIQEQVGGSYAIDRVIELLTAQHIDADGTLWITVPDIERVTRVIVDEDKSKFCRQFYMDAQPEPCEDAVSRKDCLQALSHLMDVEGFRDGWAVSRANVECMLKSMPPVTPKQRTGKWIKITNTLYKCDQCGAVQLKGNYCKDCEAKMEGANNESD